MNLELDEVKLKEQALRAANDAARQVIESQFSRYGTGEGIAAIRHHIRT